MNGETAPKFQTATLISRFQLASKFHYFLFRTETPFTYAPGQYISVKVASDRLNAYSIAHQNDPNSFTILVDISPGGPGSIFFENLKVNEKINFLGPFGIFSLKTNDGAARLLFLGTGSGCSPLRSILENALQKSSYQIPMTLYFGLRFRGDIFWQDYFKDLARQHPNFNYKVVLSKPDEGWQGLSGHITDIVDKEVANASDCAAYLCGNKQMVEEASKILLAKGCPKERIYSERF